HWVLLTNSANGLGDFRNFLSVAAADCDLLRDGVHTLRRRGSFRHFPESGSTRHPGGRNSWGAWEFPWPCLVAPVECLSRGGCGRALNDKQQAPHRRLPSTKPARAQISAAFQLMAIS